MTLMNQLSLDSEQFPSILYKLDILDFSSLNSSLALQFACSLHFYPPLPPMPVLTTLLERRNLMHECFCSKKQYSEHLTAKPHADWTTRAKERLIFS